MFKNIANIDSFLNNGDYNTKVIPELEEIQEQPRVKPLRQHRKARVLSMLLLTALIGTAAGIGC